MGPHEYGKPGSGGDYLRPSVQLFTGARLADIHAGNEHGAHVISVRRLIHGVTLKKEGLARAPDYYVQALHPKCI